MINTFSNFRESLAPFNELDLAYLAGMIDADGFITIQRTTKANTGKCEHPSVYHALKVGIGGTERQPHDLASSIFGGAVSRYTPKNEMREERDSFWRQMLALNNPRNLRVGKKAAGRLLDCRTWDEMPEAVHA